VNESIYTHISEQKKMLSVSFYRPVDYFSGTFNRFVTWMTAGEFCHCELVVHSTPDEIMTAVKSVYQAAQKGQYDTEDCNRILGQIEMYFFDTHFRKAAQSQDKMALSFSLLWGYPMSVRVLQETAHDSWFKIPTQTDSYATLVPVPEIPNDKLQETLRFSIEELGKNYDSSGALFSWLPFTSSEHKSSHESYFCSEFVVTALQRIGHLPNVDALHTTPNALYQQIAPN
jgi:hypothetical protein|tara:strand:- start:3817 stop:4503 length:687 start_codon:yes stop_codon:yes gene_type:complete